MKRSSWDSRTGSDRGAASTMRWIALDRALMTRKVEWVLDADVRGFFESISHEWLVKFVEHRIGDRRIVRLIKQWLRAGVLEDGSWTQQEEGTPQGGSATPPTMLQNGWLSSR